MLHIFKKNKRWSKLLYEGIWSGPWGFYTRSLCVLRKAQHKRVAKGKLMGGVKGKWSVRKGGYDTILMDTGRAVVWAEVTAPLCYSTRIQWFCVWCSMGDVILLFHLSFVLIHYCKLQKKQPDHHLPLREGDLFQRALPRDVTLQVQLCGENSPW